MTLLRHSCSQITAAVTDYLERALSAEEVLAFETHVVYCPGCVVFFDQVRSTVEGLRGLAAPAAPAQDRAAILDAFVARR